MELHRMMTSTFISILICSSFFVTTNTSILADAQNITLQPESKPLSSITLNRPNSSLATSISDFFVRSLSLDNYTLGYRQVNGGIPRVWTNLPDEHLEIPVDSFEDQSLNDTMRTIVTGYTADKQIKLTHVTTYNTGDQLIKMTITCENISLQKLHDIRYLRILDIVYEEASGQLPPDMSIEGTVHQVVKNFSVDIPSDEGIAVVAAIHPSHESLGALLSYDPRSRAAVFPRTIDKKLMLNPYVDSTWKARGELMKATMDYRGAVGTLSYQLGDLSVGQKVSFEYTYFLGSQLDQVPHEPSEPAMPKLKSLLIQGAVGAMTPSFHPSINQYAWDIEDRDYTRNSISIVPTAEGNSMILVNEQLVMSGSTSPPILIRTGSNLIDIQVISADGFHKQTYQLTVYRHTPGLIDLKLNPSDTPILLEPRQYVYGVVVPHETETISLTPMQSQLDSEVTITVNGQLVVNGSQSQMIPISQNIVNDVVIRYSHKNKYDIPEDLIYMIKITRQPANVGGGKGGSENIGHPKSGITTSLIFETMEPVVIDKGIIEVSLKDGDVASPGVYMKKTVQISDEQMQKSIESLSSSLEQVVQLLLIDPLNQVSEIKLELSQTAIDMLKRSGAGFAILTRDVSMSLPKKTVAAIPKDFALTINTSKSTEAHRQEEIKANQQIKQLMNTENVTIQWAGNPIQIITNLQGHEVEVTIPINETWIPREPIQRQKYLNRLVLFIAHSDGENVFTRGKLKMNSLGKLTIETTTNTFSMFNTLSMSQAPVAQLPYMLGYPDRSFKPNASISRSEIASIISRLTYKSSSEVVTRYVDVPIEHWAYQAISMLSGLKIMTAYEQGRFYPQRVVTRGEMAVILTNWIGLTQRKSTAIGDITGHSLQVPIEKVIYAGYMIGDPSGSFRPDEPLSRAETVVMINRILERKPMPHTHTFSWTDIDVNFWGYSDIQAATQSSQ